MPRSLALMLACLCLVTGAAAQDSAARAPAERRSGGDLFIAGSTVTVREPVAGDLIAAGGSVDVDAAVAGDAVAVGGKLRLGVDVGRTVYALGGQLTLNGKVGHNARLAGGQVELGPTAEVAGNLSLAGGQLRLLGAVRGELMVAGGRVLIDAPVGGDVIATAGELELGPNARIAGRLRYRSGEELRRDPAAVVDGGVEKLLPSLGRGDRPAHEPRRGIGPGVGVAFGAVWTLGLMLLALALLAMLPGFWNEVSRTLRERPGTSLLLGFALLVCTPVAVLIFVISLVGIPLGLFTLAAYLTLLPIGYIATAIGLGDSLLQRWRAERAARLRWRFAAAALALVVLGLLGALPWLGALVGLAALLAGLGALAWQLRRLAPGAR